MFFNLVPYIVFNLLSNKIYKNYILYMDGFLEDNKEVVMVSMIAVISFNFLYNITRIIKDTCCKRCCKKKYQE